MRRPTSKKKNSKTKRERERDVYSSSLKLPYNNVIVLSEELIQHRNFLSIGTNLPSV